jgi:hypothetical protein
MEQTSKLHLQNKADAMLACLEFIKVNVKSEDHFGKIAQGKNKLSKKYVLLNKIIALSVISCFFILTLYILYYGFN